MKKHFILVFTLIFALLSISCNSDQEAEINTGAGSFRVVEVKNVANTSSYRITLADGTKVTGTIPLSVTGLKAGNYTYTFEWLDANKDVLARTENLTVQVNEQIGFSTTVMNVGETFDTFFGLTADGQIRLRPYITKSSHTSLTNLIIPQTVDGKPVKKIAYQGFKSCTAIQTLTLPSSITVISDSAFEGCNKLTSVTIPESVTDIGNSAFSGCSKLENVTLPVSLKKINNYCFNNCTSLVSINIGNQVASIGSYAFNGCTALTLPSVFVETSNSNSQLVEIGSYAFQSCKFTEIDVPSNVEHIRAAAFNNCTSLSNIRLPENLKSLGSLCFANTAICSVTIPKYVDTRPQQTFRNCKNLTSVTFAGKNTASKFTFGYAAFEGCSKLNEIELPDNTSGFGTWLFNGCSSLTDLTIPEKVTVIPDGCFFNCKSMITCNISEKTTSVGSYAFKGCENLQELFIPSSVAYINYYAFQSLTSDTTIKFECSENNNTMFDNMWNTNTQAKILWNQSKNN